MPPSTLLGAQVARIIERTTKNGAKSWLVKWRIGGGRNGKEDFETCYDRQTADDFAALVTLSGENRPHGYPKGCHGIEDPRSLCPAGTRPSWWWAGRMSASR